jgi:hypothetical protein
MKFRHFIQHIVFVSVFVSLWWPDLIWLGSIFYGIGSIDSSKLIKMWRKMKWVQLSPRETKSNQLNPEYEHRLEIEVRLRRTRSEIDVMSKWNRSEIQVTSNWNCSDSFPSPSLTRPPVPVLRSQQIQCASIVSSPPLPPILLSSCSCLYRYSELKCSRLAYRSNF